MTRRRRRARDTVTILKVVDGTVLTKRIQRDDAELLITGYDQGFWFAVEEPLVTGLLDLGALLARLERDSKPCIIRSRPLPGIHWNRWRRLLYPLVDDQGQAWGPTFEPAPRRWIALDFDDLPTPEWNEDDLARRKAILVDYAVRSTPDTGALVPAFDCAVAFEDEAERLTWQLDIAGDADPAPIDPVEDWALVCRTAASTVPPEFHDVSAWWQMTSSAGIKPGVRLRLWYWLGRAINDQACKRWLAAAPVDRALFSAVQIHYTSAPLFADRADDPVPVRSGWWWRHGNTVTVPELPEPVDVDQAIGSGGERRAQAYAAAEVQGVATASAGTRHRTLMAVAVRLYSLADKGLLDHGEVSRQLLAAAEAPLSAAERRRRCTRRDGHPSENEQAIDWARARARAFPDLPRALRP
jgi:hypothetical protein